MDNFNNRWSDDTQHPNISRDTLRQPMTLRYFCINFNAREQKKLGEDISTLHITLRKPWSKCKQFLQPVCMTPHLTSRKANPQCGKHWDYCRVLCLSNIPCNTTADILPRQVLEDDQLCEYWINKYQTEFSENLALLPKWARAFHMKYYGDKGSSSSSTDSDSEPDKAVEVSDNDEREAVSDSSKSSSEEDLEPDLRATRNENRFLLNQEDQLHFRAMDDIDNDTAMPIPNLANLSNPRGEDWQKWMEGQIRKPYNSF